MLLNYLSKEGLELQEIQILDAYKDVMYPEILAQFSGLGNPGISRQFWNEQMNNNYALAQLGVG